MTGPQTTAKQDLQAIDRVRATHVGALNDGNAEAWIGVFADDGVQMPPHQPANVGKEAIRQWVQAFMASLRLEFALAVDEVRVTADWAFERGRYTITLTPKAGAGPMNDAGKYITIYERGMDGAWRMARDIWNSDNPPPGA